MHFRLEDAEPKGRSGIPMPKMHPESCFRRAALRPGKAGALRPEPERVALTA